MVARLNDFLRFYREAREYEATHPEMRRGEAFTSYLARFDHDAYCDIVDRGAAADPSGDGFLFPDFLAYLELRWGLEAEDTWDRDAC